MRLGLDTFLDQPLADPHLLLQVVKFLARNLRECIRTIQKLHRCHASTFSRRHCVGVEIGESVWPDFGRLRPSLMTPGVPDRTAQPVPRPLAAPYVVSVHSVARRSVEPPQ